MPPTKGLLTCNVIGWGEADDDFVFTQQLLDQDLSTCTTVVSSVDSKKHFVLVNPGELVVNYVIVSGQHLQCRPQDGVSVFYNAGCPNENGCPGIIRQMCTFRSQGIPYGLNDKLYVECLFQCHSEHLALHYTVQFKASRKPKDSWQLCEVSLA